MATKLLIVFPLKNSAHYPPQGRFRRSFKHDSHIWDEREYDTASEDDMKEFNAVIDKALAYYPERLPRPTVKTVFEAPSIEEVPVGDSEPHESHLQVPLEPSAPASTGNVKKRHARRKRTAQPV